MTAPWIGARRNNAYKAAAREEMLARTAWENYLREDAYRTAAHMVRNMFPDRPELRDLLDDIAKRLEGSDE